MLFLIHFLQDGILSGLNIPMFDAYVFYCKKVLFLYPTVYIWQQKAVTFFRLTSLLYIFADDRLYITHNKKDLSVFISDKSFHFVQLLKETHLAALRDALESAELFERGYDCAGNAGTTLEVVDGEIFTFSVIFGGL